jgi:hypothetical protein
LFSYEVNPARIGPIVFEILTFKGVDLLFLKTNFPMLAALTNTTSRIPVQWNTG